MLLTAPLLSKSTFFGSFLNKCRTAIINPPAIANNGISTSAVSLKSIEEKVGLPPRPKRPLTPYFRYLREMRPKMTAENPKIHLTAIISQLAKTWPSVDPSIKKKFQDEFKREQQTYVEQRLKYDSKITEEQRTEIENLKREQEDAKSRRKMRQRVRALGRPKRPSSAFLMFLQKERQSTPQLPQQTYREWHQKCVAKWTRMTDPEKESYMLAAKEEFDKYRKNLAAWEEKMMRLGNIDVVRVGQLVDPPELKKKSKENRGSKLDRPINEEVLPQQSKQKRR